MQAVSKLDSNNMYQISMDEPSVNLKFLEKTQKDQVANEFHKLLNIGSCGLYTIHNAFKVGVEPTKHSCHYIAT